MKWTKREELILIANFDGTVESFRHCVELVNKLNPTHPRKACCIRHKIRAMQEHGVIRHTSPSSPFSRNNYRYAYQV